jgi:hypothetical protein
MLRAVADVAHEAGITVSGHLGLIDAREAANNGIDGLQHATGVALATIKDSSKIRRIREAYSNIGYSPVEFYMEPEHFDELIDDLLEHQVAIIPTLYHYIGKKVCPRKREYFEEDQAFLRSLDPQFFPHEAVHITYRDEPYEFQTLPLNDRDSYMDKMEVGWKKLAEFVARFKKQGGTVLAGSDDGNVGLPGKGLHREVEILVNTCGFTPTQAIAAATIEAARFLRHEELGSIRNDNLADLIVLNANPLEKITNTQTISAVIQDGRIIEAKVASRYANPLPLPASAGSGPIPIVDFIPRISWIQPTYTYEGSSDVSVTITGKNFAPVSSARFDVTDLRTKYVDASHVEITIPAPLLAVPGSYPLTVTNPGSGGGPSNIADFLVRFRYSRAELSANAAAANPQHPPQEAGAQHNCTNIGTPNQERS